jgi:DNA-directed RNA polymerase specialized sigma24 family protein
MSRIERVGQPGDLIDELFLRLKSGEADAAQALWNEYSAALVNLAKRRFGKFHLGMTDEEDVALSVFGSICRGAAEGRFLDIITRDELWWLLLRITKQKVVDHIRREMAIKRRGRHEPTEGNNGANKAALCVDDLVSRAPSPDFLLVLEEEYTRLMKSLRDDRLRTIVSLRIEGLRVSEIAQRLSINVRAVERKLQLIRVKWTKELMSSIGS